MNDEATPKRSYDRSLRSRQAGQTRELILNAAAELIAEDGLQALSVAEVARRAGVSLRTVWRNFANLDELIDAVDRLAAETGPTLIPPFEVFDAHTETQYEFFEEHASFILATLYWRFAQGQAPPARMERLQAIIKRFEEVTPGLSPDLRRAGEAMLALLPSGMAWATLRKEFGWSAKESGQAVGWIVQLVIDELVRLSAGGEPRPRLRPSDSGEFHISEDKRG